MVNRYVYDETNRLSEVINAKGEAAKYRYDGLGKRVGRQGFFFDEKSAFHLGKIQPETNLFENPEKEVIIFWTGQRPIITCWKKGRLQKIVPAPKPTPGMGMWLL